MVNSNKKRHKGKQIQFKMKNLEQRKNIKTKLPSAITENIPKEIFRSETFKDITK